MATLPKSRKVIYDCLNANGKVSQRLLIARVGHLMNVEPCTAGPLSALDIACLRIEDRTSLAINAGIMVFAEPLEFQRVTAALKDGFLCFRRFRQRLVWPLRVPAPPRWEDDARFDLAWHVQHTVLPDPGDDPALSRALSDLISTPLERGRPLWQIHLIERYGEGCALLFRIHHSLADGMALLHVLRSMTGGGRHTCGTDPDLAGRPPRAEPRPTAEIHPLVASGLISLSQIELLLYEGIASLFRSSARRGAARAVWDAAGELGKLLLMESGSRTVFSGALGAAKQVAWSRPVPMGHVRAIARFHGGTLTEVLFSAVTGSLRRYLEHRGEPVGGITVRASVPINVRRVESPLKLGNRFSMNFLALPIEFRDPAERLNVIHQRLEELKNSAQTEVLSGLMNLYGVAPKAIGNLLLGLAGKKVTAVLSLLPGLPTVRNFGAKPIERLIFWVPQSGRLGLGMSLLPYKGSVTLGVAADAGLVLDPERIARGFEEELNAWARAVRCKMNSRGYDDEGGKGHS
jgi:WS/DGAT/MGAT family acyltransferase